MSAPSCWPSRQNTVEFKSRWKPSLRQASMVKSQRQRTPERFDVRLRKAQAQVAHGVRAWKAEYPKHGIQGPSARSQSGWATAGAVYHRDEESRQVCASGMHWVKSEQQTAASARFGNTTRSAGGKRLNWPQPVRENALLLTSESCLNLLGGRSFLRLAVIRKRISGFLLQRPALGR